MGGRIVMFGATGYTGDLVSRALVDRGARPVLAGRSPTRLERLAAELGGLETRTADVDRPETVRALVEPGDVLVSTVGPFVRWGDPAVRAAVDAGAHYFDSTGEPAFIRRVFEDHGPPARAAGCALMTAFGYDWVPGNLAAALALRDAGPRAVRVEVGYFSRGGTMSGGTRASMAGAALDPSFVFRAGRLHAERVGARVRDFEVVPGKHRSALSVGGSEHLALPALHPTLRDVDVFVVGPGVTRVMPALSLALTTAAKAPVVGTGLRALVRRRTEGATAGPDAGTRARDTSVILAEAFSTDGDLLQRVRLEGVNGYTFTAGILAWGAHTAATGGLRDVGALGPVAAFGLSTLEDGAREAGIARM